MNEQFMIESTIIKFMVKYTIYVRIKSTTAQYPKAPNNRPIVELDTHISQEKCLAKAI